MKTFIISALFGLAVSTHAWASDISLFAAASLKGALDEIGAAYQAKGGSKTVVTYAATGTLAKQIEAAAPADVFISADQDWMDYLQAKALIKPDTRRDIIGNTLVVIDTAQPTRDIGALFVPQDLASVVPPEHLALADVTSVPAGRYCKEALEKLGIWEKVKPAVVMQENVRATLALVARGEAAYGIVYGSDAWSEPKVRVAALIDEKSHRPIRYPAAVVANSQNAEADAFVMFLSSGEARAIFLRYGFSELK